MKSILELAYKKHSDWNNIVKSFGCNPSMSEDVVMEMYIQLDADVKKGLDLYYKDQINHYYCYKVLRGIYTNLLQIDWYINNAPKDNGGLFTLELTNASDTGFTAVFCPV